jgi:uncharacterized membrane protein
MNCALLQKDFNHDHGLRPESRGEIDMVLMMPLVAHVLMSLVMLSIPYLTRREILFGVVLPADFRSRREARRAIRMFQMTVAISAIAGLLAIVLLSSRFVGIALFASGAMMVLGFTAFVIQNRKLRAFAIQPSAVRELELSAEPERLPRFVWLGLVPLVILAATAFYLHAHWDSIPERRPVHWGLDGQPNRWADRTPQGVYGPLVFGAGMTLWLFGFSLAIWYGSRRTEPLRRPALGVFTTLQWVLVLMIPGVAMQGLIRMPVGLLIAVSIALILGSVAYLIRANRNSRGPVDPSPQECWKGGILYYNPDDPVLFVGRRDGAGFTLNMGNPWSWVVIGSPLLIALSGFLIRP